MLAGHPDGYILLFQHTSEGVPSLGNAPVNDGRVEVWKDLRMTQHLLLQQPHAGHHDCGSVEKQAVGFDSYTTFEQAAQMATEPLVVSTVFEAIWRKSTW